MAKATMVEWLRVKKYLRPGSSPAHSSRSESCANPAALSRRFASSIPDGSSSRKESVSSDQSARGVEGKKEEGRRKGKQASYRRRGRRWVMRWGSRRGQRRRERRRPSAAAVAAGEETEVRRQAGPCGPRGKLKPGMMKPRNGINLRGLEKGFFFLFSCSYFTILVRIWNFIWV